MVRIAGARWRPFATWLQEGEACSLFPQVALEGRVGPVFILEGGGVVTTLPEEVAKEGGRVPALPETSLGRGEKGDPRRLRIRNKTPGDRLPVKSQERGDRPGMFGAEIGQGQFPLPLIGRGLRFAALASRAALETEDGLSRVARPGPDADDRQRDQP